MSPSQPLAVCVECGVSRLVYTSTYNVVFGGQEIRNGDHLEVLPDHKVGGIIGTFVITNLYIFISLNIFVEFKF